MGYELYHHGILGMKWGVRRYQNEDGSLTEAGKRRLRKNAQAVIDRQREYDRAGFFKKGKARKKLDEAKARQEKFVSKLAYSKMSDEQLIQSSKDFVSKMQSSEVSAITGSQNVKAGERSLEDKIRLYSSIVAAGASTVNLVNGVRTLASGIKNDKQQRELNERRMQLEEKKFINDRFNADRKYRDDRADAERKYQDDRDFAERKYLDERKLSDRKQDLEERKYRDSREDKNWEANFKKLSKTNSDLKENVSNAEKRYQDLQKRSSEEISRLGQLKGNLEAENRRLSALSKRQLEVNSSFREKNKALEKKADVLINSIVKKNATIKDLNESYSRANSDSSKYFNELNLADRKIDQLYLDLEKLRKNTYH